MEVYVGICIFLVTFSILGFICYVFGSLGVIFNNFRTKFCPNLQPDLPYHGKALAIFQNYSVSLPQQAERETPGTPEHPVPLVHKTSSGSPRMSLIPRFS